MELKMVILTAKNKKSISKKLYLWLSEPFLYAQFCYFLPHKQPFLTKSTLFFRPFVLKMVVITLLIDFFGDKQK
jgi:hypothetical protein